MTERFYFGMRMESGCRVCWRENRVAGDLPLRLDLWNHSPTGFEWGYGGSGPAQLALALLADALQDTTEALILHQRYKSRVVGCLPKPGWTLTRTEIKAVVMQLREEDQEQELREQFKAP
jgi:hypothetical protein